MEKLKFSLATTCGMYAKELQPATAKEVLRPEKETRFFTELQGLTNRLEPEKADINCVVFDIEYKHDTRTFDEIDAEIKEVFSNIIIWNYIVYTTKSYKTEKPCFRLLLPLDKPLLQVNIKAYKRIKMNLCRIHDNECGLFYQTPPENSVIANHIEPNKPNFPSNKIAYLIKQYEEKERHKNNYLEVIKNKYKADFTEALHKEYIIKCAETMNQAPQGSRNETANKILWILKQKQATSIDIAFLIQNLTNEDNKQEFLQVLNHNGQYRNLRTE